MVSRYTKNPERISNLDELNRVLEAICQYGKSIHSDDVGVLLIQNMSLGAVYMVYSYEGTKEMFLEKNHFERAVKFYDMKYFLDLKEKFIQ